MPNSKDIKKPGSASSSSKKKKNSASSSLDDSPNLHSDDSNSDVFSSIASTSHTMVQERFDQMIRDRSMRIDKLRNEGLRKKSRSKVRLDDSYSTKSIVMVALDKYSYDPREDIRESMVEVIMSNQIEEARDLRKLLNCYISMNSAEYRSIILEVFHEVCTNIFMYCTM
ncbi:hypothetical protein C5167_023526 [Papaver somniferum]|uniref:Transcription repressor n=1 Tax=Papaver somniferum TaxID=3469 RepID=A0A4Y7JM15_PAPSO|nr:hypothetical protein C5167_023526 [Papaver somniferum]